MSLTYTSAQDGTDVDSWFASNAPTNNYGTDAGIHIGEDKDSASVRRAVINFVGLYGGSISPYAIVDSANIYLTVSSDYTNNVRTLRVYRLKTTWAEGSVTWNSPWGTAGAYATADCELTDIGSASQSASPSGVLTIPLTASAIQEIVAGTWTNKGFLFKMDTETDDMTIYGSSEHATAGNRPKIVVNYHMSDVRRSFIL
jgi:hypothetical protein